VTLDASIVGESDETLTVTLQRDRLIAFVEVIGETGAIYNHGAAARRAGYPDIPAPLTYAFSLGLARKRPLGFLQDRGVEVLRLLHGEQAFVYHGMMFAGQTVTVSRTVVDYYERKNGNLQFIVVETRIHTMSGDPVVTSRETFVLTNTPAKAKVGPNSQDVAPGENKPSPFPPIQPGKVTPALLRNFAQVSGDLNPIHVDRVAAHKAGYDEVFAHGMLSMAWLGRLLANWARPEAVRRFSVRFHAITPLHAEPLCEGWLEAEADSPGANVGLRVRLRDGRTTLTGVARLGP
jgi:acyl dehydratase